MINLHRAPWVSFATYHGSEPVPAVNTSDVWLLATMSHPSGAARRQMIRETWQRLYPPDFEMGFDLRLQYRFVLGQPDDALLDAIRSENRTYGDLLVLPQLQASERVANTVKPIEFLKHLRSSGMMPRFVSKVDTDSFINVPAFYHQFLSPLDSSVHNYLAGRDWGWDFSFVGGPFYTLSGALAKTLADLHDLDPVQTIHEDTLVGHLIDEADLNIRFGLLDTRQAFDVDFTCFDASRLNHAVLPGAINPHKLKRDSDYLTVAALFNRQGLDVTKVLDL
jgi:hypothetical protein